ncbi:MAG: magnesium transporter [Chloroflexota bacterium]|nr:magnesium transporter [Chloroflexota bacterium]
MAAEELLAELRDLIRNREDRGIRGLASRLDPAEWADLVPRLDDGDVDALLDLLPADEIPALLEEVDPADAAVILSRLSPAFAADLLEAMDPDDATDVIEQLPRDQADRLLTEMEPDEAAEIEELRAFPPDTAGGRMTPAYVAVSPEILADEAIVALRQVAAEAETIYYVYVIDEEEHLLGVLPLHNLVLTGPNTPVSEVMVRDPIRVHAETDQETAARLLTDHNLLALPVVDDQDHLLGIITEDDIAEILEEEATEDIERLGGSQPLDIPYRLASVPLLVRRRVGWLLFLFVAGLLTSQVLRIFEDRLQQTPALNLFLPLIIGIGGNVGSQTVTTLVRAIGVGEVQLRDVGWVLAKEIAVGLVMGLILGLAGFARVGFSDGLAIGLIVGVTIAGVTVWSAMVAAILPLILRRINIDPAVVSAPFISTLVDATGLLIYMLVAGLVLSRVL